MRLPKEKLKDAELVALVTIAKVRVPQMIVLYADTNGTPAAYINLN